jgi:hypothetical protein
MLIGQRGVNYNVNRAERSISGRLGLSQTKLNVTSQPFNEYTTVNDNLIHFNYVYNHRRSSASVFPSCYSYFWSYFSYWSVHFSSFGGVISLSKMNLKLHYDRLSVGQFILVSCPFWSR